MNIFSRFSANEKMLIALAVGLCVVLGGWQFVIKPISNAKNKTALKYSAAVRDYDIVQRAIPRLTSRAPQSGAEQDFNRAAIIETARNVNIAISRVEPAGNGEVQVWFDETTSAQIYNFLQALEGQYAVNTLSAQLNRRENGLVSAQFTFMPINAVSGI